MKAVSKFFASVPPFFSDLASSIAGDIDCSLRTLSEYSHDNGIYSVRPQAVIYPKTSTDIKQVIIFAREYGMPISVAGGKSGEQGGALTEGIILDMSRHFNQIRRANMINNTITVDAGVSIATLVTKLRGWNMEIPILSSNDEQGTIAGLLATKSTTPSSFHHGTIREWLEGVTVVLDNGEEHHITDGITPSGRLLAIYQELFPLLTREEPMLRAAKPQNKDDASGYNIWGTSIGPRQLLDQLTGSDGTLAIITSLTLRVRTYKKSSLTYAFIVPQEHIHKTLSTLESSGVDSLFIYDEHFAMYAKKSYPNIVYQNTNTVTTPLYTILATTCGMTSTEVDKKMYDHIKKLKHELGLEESNIVHLQEPAQKLFTAPGFASHILHEYVQGRELALPLIHGLLTSKDNYATLIKEVERYLFSINKLYVICGHAGSSHLSVTILADPKSETYETDIFRYINDIYKLAKKHKATTGGLGGDGYANTPYLPLFYNEATIDIFKKVKNIWDPLSIFNPSKKTELSSAFLKAHIRRV